MRARAVFALVLTLAAAVAVCVWAVPPASARLRTTVVTCNIADHFSGFVESDSNVGYLDFSIGERCDHYASLMAIKSTMYLNDTPAAGIVETCLGKRACSKRDYVTSNVPVNVQLKSNWAITLPKRFKFNLKSFPAYCVGKSRTVACHHVTPVQTLG